MSDLAGRLRTQTGRPLAAVIWFFWMVAMWAAFFTLLVANQLGDVWNKATQLPLVAEVLLWIAFLPWILATWVWTGPWPEWLRIVLVLCFTIGWTFVSIPRKRRGPA